MHEACAQQQSMNTVREWYEELYCAWAARFKREECCQAEVHYVRLRHDVRRHAVVTTIPIGVSAL